MIKIKSIHVKKFRGIIDLKIDIGGKNCTICGPNGTGKSGIIDAIEFALSGEISRLSGTGRGDVSIKNHAPHVDYRDNPEEASVSLSGIVVKTGDTFEITRNVADIDAPVITPQTSAVLETLQQLAERKNISLSRRELIQYIISTKKDRVKQVNALLQLGQLISLRDTFQKISNAEERSRKECECRKKAAAEQLSQALNILQLKVPDLLAEVNKRRKTLGLEELEKLEANTSLIDGLATLKVSDTKKAIDKKAAENDLAKLQQEISSVNSKDIETALQTAVHAVRDLSSNKMAWSGISKQNLLKDALKHLDSAECPVCETPWELEALKKLVETNISSLETAVASKNQILRGLSDAFLKYRSLGQASKLLGSYDDKFEPKHNTELFKATASDIETHIKAIEGFASEEAVVEALEKLENCCGNLRAPHADLQTKVQALEEKSDPLAARDFLTVANERLIIWRDSSRALQKAEASAKTAKTVFETYTKSYEDGLNNIYLGVQKEFADFYKSVNAEDESGFSAILAASKSGLDLNVDFYGKGKFPPSAYHSEGHQDGMGFCLYLALMKYLYADEFQVCVLDDVLMSVDGSHRRAVCELIQREFPNTQFVFTTHDEVWLKNMQTTGIIGSRDFIRFRKWDVETGPHEWEGRDVWHEIDDKLSKNEVNSAAHTLRYYLEFVFGEICNNLEAQVVYRGDNQHSLGDLLPQGFSRMNKLLGAAKEVAEHWNKSEDAAKIETFKSELSSAFQATRAEQWAVNPSVHYNEWANLQVADFRPVSVAFKTLCNLFFCSDCGSALRLSKVKHKKDALKCNCGTHNHNLNKG